MKAIVYPITGILVLLLSVPALAGQPVFTGEDDDVAVKGYDVVAYFTRGEPTEGSPEHALQWQGAEWRFANAEHLALFRENPRRYAPAYGGYCAYGVVKGKALASSPEYWTIEDGRLYLNLNAEVQKLWDEDRQTHIRTADGNWPDLARN